MVHHGAAMASRRIELMIDLMDSLDERFSLDFLLVPHDPRYLSRLQRMAKNRRIRFLPPVPFDDLIPLTSRYDIGLFLLPPTNFNYRMALPNKFFEFIQARLAVAIGPSPEMAGIVRQFDCGVVGQTFEPKSLAKVLNASSAQRIDEMKRGAERAAATLNADANEEHFLSLVETLLERRSNNQRPIPAVHG